MFQRYGCVLFACITLLCGQLRCVDQGNVENTKEISEENANDCVSDYEKLSPIIGWNRFLGDCARSIKGWCRWWSYLRMKTPEIIDWIEGLKLKIYPGNEIYRAIFVRGIYDPNLIVVVNSFLTDGSVFIDAGTGIGHFSLLASRVIGKNGRIYAVEPSSRDFERLCDNIELNKLPDVVHPRQFAFLDKNGTEQLSIACEERNLINTIGTEFSSKGVDKIKTEKVNVVRIDDFVENERINKVDFIKLDVEGSETRALRGARNTIEKYRPSLMVGVNETALKSCGSCLKELQQMLRDFKYRTYRLRDDSFFTLEPVSDITKEHVNVVFCLPEDIMPPVLPRPKQLSSVDVIRDFLSK